MRRAIFKNQSLKRGSEEDSRRRGFCRFRLRADLHGRARKQLLGYAEQPPCFDCPRELILNYLQLFFLPLGLASASGRKEKEGEYDYRGDETKE
jgi:hypothetical protein